MAERAALPDWPRLMPLDTAAAYFGVSANTFRSLGIVPRNIGARVLFDRRDLDLFADRLGNQPLAADDRQRAMDNVERAFLDRRRRG